MIKHPNNFFNMQVRIFRTSSGDPLYIEKQVNAFLKETLNIQINDIKITSDEHGMWVFIMYTPIISDFSS